MSLPLCYSEALGTTIVLPHIDGKDLQIKVPAGTNSGDTMPFPQEVCLVELLEEDVVVLAIAGQKFNKATKKL